MTSLLQISKRIERKFSPLLFLCQSDDALFSTQAVNGIISNVWGEKSMGFIPVIAQEV